MELAWTPLALVGWSGALLDMALAAFVLATRPGATLNRRLAALLALSSLTGFTFASRLLMVDARDGFAVVVVFMLLIMLTSAAFLVLIAAIPSPLAAPLRSRAAPWVGAGALVGGIVLVLAREDLFILSVRPFVYVPGWEFINGPAWEAVSSITVATSLYGLVVAFDAWRRAPGGLAGRRAGAFALGVGVSVALQAASTAYLLSVGEFDDPFPTYVNFVGPTVASVAFSGIFAYGILRFQLLDIDVRLKWGLRRGALAGAFVAVFLAATEVAQAVFESRAGVYAGIAAAALLAFAFHPLQRVADRVADAAMPKVSTTPQYLEFRRMEIYRDALESLLADGAVTEKERVTLDRLRAKLGIAEADARALEGDVAAQAVPATMPRS